MTKEFWWNQDDGNSFGGSKKSKIKIIVIIVIGFSMIATFILVANENCNKVYQDYRTDPVHAEEKHGFDTYQEWLKSKGNRMQQSCKI